MALLMRKQLFYVSSTVFAHSPNCCFSYSESKPVLMDICMFYGTKMSVAFGPSNKICSYTETSSTVKALNTIINYHESLSTSSSGTTSFGLFLPASINQNL